MAVPTVDLVGIRAPKFRYESRANVNPTWISRDQGRPIQLNRVDYDRTSGSIIGVQIGPNVTATTTHQATGTEIRARSGNVATGGLLAVNADVNASSSSEDVNGSVKAVEANITVKGTRTVDSVVAALRAFLDVDSTVTVTGKKSVIVVATPNVSGWDNLVDSETNAGLHVVGAGTYSTADGYFKVRVAGSDYRIPFFTDVD